MATRKAQAATKPAAKKKSSAPEDRTDKLIANIVNQRKAGTKWAEIAESVGLPIGKTILLYEMGSVPKSERITGSDREIGLAIVKAREVQKLSWGRIMARTGMGQQACKNLYMQYAKDPSKGARIGKGGRYPGDATPPKDDAPKAAKTTKATKAPKAAPAAKAKPVKATAAKPAKVTNISEAKAKKVAGRPRKRHSVNPGEVAVGAEDSPF